MRRNLGLAIFISVNALVIGFFVVRLWNLMALFVFDGSNDAILHAEINETLYPLPDSTLPTKLFKHTSPNSRYTNPNVTFKPQIIPKIIHQTYANTSIPVRWIEPQRSCIALHTDYEYKLWTDTSAREFIAKEYPWFLSTWDSYPYNIQRADAIRYFALAHFGGIYIDLDDGCNRRLDPLLVFPAWLRRTTPTGISNDAMGSIPRHPFFLRVIETLPSYNRKWILPYITVMASTGPLFLSIMWRQYMSEMPPEQFRIRLLFPDAYANNRWSFFVHNIGNSWHQSDVHLILWMSHHWMLLTTVGFILAGFFFMTLWWIFSGLVLTRSPKTRHALKRRINFWNRCSETDSPAYSPLGRNEV